MSDFVHSMRNWPRNFWSFYSKEKFFLEIFISTIQWNTLAIHSKLLNESPKPLVIYSNVLMIYPNVLVVHSKHLVVYSNVLVTHSNVLVTHSNVLVVHSKAFSEPPKIIFGAVDEAFLTNIYMNIIIFYIDNINV